MKTAPCNDDSPVAAVVDAGSVVRRPYEPPAFDVHALRLVTLGGTPGAGDSGAPGSQDPLGGASGSPQSGGSAFFGADDDPNQQNGPGHW